MRRFLGSWGGMLIRTYDHCRYMTSRTKPSEGNSLLDIHQLAPRAPLVLHLRRTWLESGRRGDGHWKREKDVETDSRH